jgi:hypothetical protein
MDGTAYVAGIDAPGTSGFSLCFEMCLLAIIDDDFPCCEDGPIAT